MARVNTRRMSTELCCELWQSDADTVSLKAASAAAASSVLLPELAPPLMMTLACVCRILCNVSACTHRVVVTKT